MSNIVPMYGFGGGGGTSLNFKVICNPQPETAKENTIWVDTDRINNYYFSSEQPENMAEYDVWFLIGTSSTVKFSATKKNPIMVYPLSAKQMVSGALVDKTAKSFQGGAWVDWFVWDGELFDNGNEFADVTGGWGRHSGLTETGMSNTGTVTIGDTLYIYGATNVVAVASILDMVDLTEYSTLHVQVSAVVSGVRIGVHKNTSGDFTSNCVATQYFGGEAGEKTLRIDAINEKCYVSVLTGNGGSATITKIWLTK